MTASAPTLEVELREIAQASIRTIIKALKELSITFPKLQIIAEVIANVVSIVDVSVLRVQMTPSVLLTRSSDRDSHMTKKNSMR